MAIEIIGKFVEQLPVRSGTSGRGGEWSVQEFILETGGQYPKKVCISLWNDKIDLLKNLTVGDDIKATVDIESREYNGRWYTSVKAWQLEKLMQHGNIGEKLPEIPPHSLSDIPPEEEDDDLPF